jgi:hypothetical protein
MGLIKCNNCGIQAEETARFCRRCGQPVSRMDPGPDGYFSPTDYEAPTRPMNDGFTSPSYYPTAPAPSTNNLARGNTRRTALVLGIAVGALLLIVAFLAAYIALNDTDAPADEVTITAPPPERPGGVIPHPPIPPGVPPPPPAVGGSGTGRRVDVPRYPGAEEIMEVVSAENGNVVQLQTTDSIGKVTDWYKTQIKSTKDIILPGGVSVLRGQGLTIVITPAGENLTHILIKQGEER